MPKKIKELKENDSEWRWFDLKHVVPSINWVDISIMALCYNKQMGVLEIQRELKIAYKNLLPHLKKLEEYKLILIVDNGRGKKKGVIVNKKNPDVVGFMILMGVPEAVEIWQQAIKKRIKK